MNRAPRAASGWFLMIGFHVASALAMALVIASAPDPSGQVALVYPPTWTPAESFAHAAATNARIVRVGRASWIVVVAPETDDFAAQARASGALLLLNPVVAGACAPKRNPNLARS